MIIFGILALGRMRPSYLKVLLLLLLPILIYFHLHGIVIGDEGHILLSSEKILSGMLPYRDFDFDYTPLSIFLTAFSFKALGASVLSSRILMIGLSLLSSLLIFKIVHYSTKNRLYSTLATLLFVSWGPPHINFSSPIIK